MYTKFHKDWLRHSIVDRGDTQTHRQHGDLVSQLFFQNKESRLKTETMCKTLSEESGRERNTIGSILNLTISPPRRKAIRFTWCVLKSTPQMNKRCSAQKPHNADALGFCRKSPLVGVHKLRYQCLRKTGAIAADYPKRCFAVFYFYCVWGCVAT
jgi:hypothetical protein